MVSNLGGQAVRIATALKLDVEKAAERATCSLTDTLLRDA